MLSILTVILSMAPFTWAQPVPPQAISPESPEAATAPAERAPERLRCYMVSKHEVPAPPRD